MVCGRVLPIGERATVPPTKPTTRPDPSSFIHITCQRTSSCSCCCPAFLILPLRRPAPRHKDPAHRLVLACGRPAHAPGAVRGGRQGHGENVRGAGLVRQHLGCLVVGCFVGRGSDCAYYYTYIKPCLGSVSVSLTLASATQLSTVWRRTESWSSLASSRNASSSCVAASSGSTWRLI